MKRKWWLVLALIFVLVGIAFLVFGRSSRLLWQRSFPRGGYFFAMDDKIGFVDGTSDTIYAIGKGGAVTPVIHGPAGFPFACFTRDSAILTAIRSKVIPTVSFLVCLDLQGHERWRYEEAGIRGFPRIADDGSIVFITDGSDLCVLWPDGRRRSKWLIGADTFDLRGNLAAAYDHFSKLIKVCDLDGNGVTKLSLPSSGIPFGIALDSQTNVFVSWANNLERYDANGARVWRRSLPMALTRKGNTILAASTGLFSPQIATDGKGHLYCHTVNGYLHAYDRSGKLLRSNPVGTSAWMDVGPDGDLIVVGEDVRLQPSSKSSSPPFTIQQTVARDDRVFCISAGTGLIWEQSLPTRIRWHLPRSRADAQTLWENALGYHIQRYFQKPLVMRDGTVLVTESSFMATNDYVYAIRGNKVRQ